MPGSRCGAYRRHERPDVTQLLEMFLVIFLSVQVKLEPKLGSFGTMENFSLFLVRIQA